MKIRLLMGLAALAWLTLPAFSQNAASSEKLSVDQINADLVKARTDNQNKQFAEAEALMLPATASRPALLYPWLELGQAQLGLKKYAAAEASFKVVLGLDPASQKRLAGASGFYTTDGVTHASRNEEGSKFISPERTPEVEGVAWSGLGEVYIHDGKTAKAQSAFDDACKTDAKNAALYRLNETILFYQAGNAPAAQVEAANEAIALDPAHAALYYFKAQGMTAQATVDPKTQKLVLPPSATAAYRKYLTLDPRGEFAGEVKGILAAAHTGGA